MLPTAQRATIVLSTPPSPPQPSLAPVRAGQAVLDGGDGPVPGSQVAEPPGLVLSVTVFPPTTRCAPSYGPRTEATTSPN
jgi:hypothetical protein